jgi:hypothetical protein
MREEKAINVLSAVSGQESNKTMVYHQAPVVSSLSTDNKIQVSDMMYSSSLTQEEETPTPERITYLNGGSLVMMGESRRYLVSKFLEVVVSRNMLSVGHLKRLLTAQLKESLAGRNVVDKVSHVEIKPNGLFVREMFDENLCQSGSTPVASSFNMAEIDEEHILSCIECSEFGFVVPTCYFATLRRTLTHGWRPPIKEADIVTAYGDGKNHKSVNAFQLECGKNIQRMVVEGVLQPTSDFHTCISNPFRAVLKNSALISATLYTGRVVANDRDLNECNLILSELSRPPLKVRMTTNCSASGVNSATPQKPFSYPSVHQAINIVYRDAWLAKGDVKSYFWLFPLAEEVTHLFGCSFLEVNYVYTKCPFGFKLCPWFCSLWAAEFRQWLLRRNVSCCHYVDDWLLVSPTEADARASMKVLTELFSRCGIEMAGDKYEFGKVLVYLGLIIDTVSLTIRFDPTQSGGFRAQLIKYYQLILGGGVLDTPTIHHVCGKLEWFSDVVQVGRAKSRSWWIYLKYVEKLADKAKIQLLQDTEWWITLLQHWSLGDVSGNEYPILSSSFILKNLDSIVMVQSDMSGPDGLGYHTYNMANPDTDISFFAIRWPDNFTPSSSMEGELLALEYFIRREGQSKYAHQRCTILWVSDSLDAVWAVLKGRCKHPAPFAVLVNILEICDSARIQLLALWVPREQNTLADYLSHLCVLLNRDCVAGEEEFFTDYVVGKNNNYSA